MSTKKVLSTQCLLTSYDSRALHCAFVAFIALFSLVCTGASVAADEPMSPEAKYAAAIEILDDKTGGKEAEAITLLREAADAGNLEAMNRLGYSLDAGLHVPKDSTAALEFYKKAADAGLAKAQFNYGLNRVRGMGGPADPAVGLEYLEKAASQNLPQAKMTLGRLYYFGEFKVNKDPEKAFVYFLELGRDGDADAQNFLGTMYGYGVGTKLDFAESASWWEKSANQGHAKAQASYGQRLLYGTGVEKNVPKGLMFLMLSAGQNEVTGANTLKDILPSMDPEDVSQANTLLEEHQEKKGSESP